MKQLLLFILLLPCLLVYGQQTLTLKGSIRDAKTGEPLIGATVSVQGKAAGTSTDLEGEFTLRATETLPLVLVVRYVGYDSLQVAVNNASGVLKIGLNESKSTMLQGVEIRDTRISQKQKQAPLTVETMDPIAIKETPAANFYEGLSHLKGVDLTSASIGFKIINTRGFNSTSPVRSLQLIDGVDNQSPGLNFSLGNFLGASELDVYRVDLIVGASGAYYGPNAFNGVINMQTRSPFLFPGLSAQVKVGERNLAETAVRWAQVFKNKKGEDKLAYKINIFYMRAHDWEARNYDATSQSPVGTGNPGSYDAVNRYGDEFSSNILHSQLSGLTNVGFGYYLRSGYNEDQLVDYNAKNLKLNGAIHYRINKDNELIAASNYSTGTTVYQGDNRFSLRNIRFYQNRLELRKEGRYFIRAYATNEDAGDSYDAYATALKLQNASKSDRDWGLDYNNYLTANLYPKVLAWYQANSDWLSKIPTANNQRLNFINDYWYANFADTLMQLHAQARQRADQNPNTLGTSLSRFEPGTARFDSAFHSITSLTNQQGGSRFFDQSGLYHVAGEYKFRLVSLDLTTGGNFRLYAPYSQGTIFLDTGSRRIYNHEVGFYFGIERKVIKEQLKLSLTNRLDKNQNFNLLWSPAATGVYTLNNTHVFRLSLSSAIRNPTLSDQYINLNVGRATLIGNLNGLDSLVTLASFGNALTQGNKAALQYFNVAPVKPERVQTIEVGYRGSALKGKLYFDANYYYSWYYDFIGYKIGARVSWPGVYVDDYTVYRITTNSRNVVTTQGFSVGFNYFLQKYLGFSANYSWNRLNQTVNDSIIPAYNTPEHKYNLGINGRDIDAKIGGLRVRHWGYSINYKWQTGFMYEGSPQFTGYVPAYGMVDAQLNKQLPKAYCTIKIGASNLLDNRVYQVYGGPRIGRLAYLSVLFEISKL